MVGRGEGDGCILCTLPHLQSSKSRVFRQGILAWSSISPPYAHILSFHHVLNRIVIPRFHRCFPQIDPVFCEPSRRMFGIIILHQSVGVWVRFINERLQSTFQNVDIRTCICMYTVCCTVKVGSIWKQLFDTCTLPGFVLRRLSNLTATKASIAFYLKFHL